MKIRTSDLAWAAGLVVGEGCFLVVKRGKKRDLTYPQFSIGMCDARAIRRFSRIASGILGRKCKPYNFFSSAGALVFRCLTAGSTAARLGVALLPYMTGTDKGDQFRSVMRKCGLSLDLSKNRRRAARVVGEDNPNCTLRVGQVRSIRCAMDNHKRLSPKQRYGMRLAERLAEHHGVSVVTIHQIARRRIWKAVRGA